MQLALGVVDVAGCIEHRLQAQGLGDGQEAATRRDWRAGVMR